MILTEQALAAAPLLKLVASADHPTVPSVAAALARDVENTRKSVKAHQAAGWIAPTVKGAPLALTDEGIEVLAAIARAESPIAPIPPTEGFAREIPLDLIDEEPGFNPRKRHDAEAHDELTASVRERGVLQPIKIRPHGEAGRFYIVMGSRRCRAAVAAGLTTIRAVVEDVPPAQAFEEAVIENVQRQDMTEMEEARAFDQIIKTRMAADPELKLKDAKAAVAAIVRRTPEYVMQRTHLLQLPEAKQQALEDGEITFTEARKWLQSRPKVLNLTPAQWLLALEVFDKVDAAPIGDDYLGRRQTEVHADARFDKSVDALVDGPDLLFSVSHVLDQIGETGRFKIGFNLSRLDQLRLKFEGGDVADPIFRAKALVAARTAAGQPHWKGLGYVTPWLNDPFEIGEGLRKEISETRARKTSERDAREAAQAAEAQAAADVRKAEDAAGLALLAAIRQLETDWASRALGPAHEDVEFRTRFAEIWAMRDVSGPFRIAPTDNPRDPTQIVDGADQPNVDRGPALEARRRLMVMALNFALGTDPFSGPAFPTPWSGGGEDLADGEDADDLDENAHHEDDAPDDQVLVPWERRLIGDHADDTHP